MVNNDRRDVGTNTDLHEDEKYEGVINDATASASESIGIRTDMKGPDHPFHVRKLNQSDMSQFEKLTRGKK